MPATIHSCIRLGDPTGTAPHPCRASTLRQGEYLRNWPSRHSACAVQGSQPSIAVQDAEGDDEIAVTLRYGESTAQLQLTRGEIKALSLETLADIWKVASTHNSSRGLQFP